MTERSAILLHIDTPTPVRLFGGPGYRKIAADDPFDPAGLYNQLDPNGAWISSVPAMRQLVGGTAEALDFTFSGVSPIPMSWVDTKAANGCRLTYGEIDLDLTGQQDGPIWWVWSGIIRSAAADDSFGVASITLRAETTCATRRRAGLKTWSNANHKLRHPTDNFFKRVTKNGLNNTVVWR
ncbi:MAG TPA: hypothetical protein VLZ84_04140 [Asticcacaulis sp.]|nr:hypothetical protein [Asticcacaulis sp.]